MEQIENVKLIVMLANAMIKRRNAKAAEFGLTSGQAHILKFLIKHQNTNEIIQSDIQNELGLAHQTVTGLIKRLEKKGYILCETSSRDQRCKRIVLTPAAFELETVLKEVSVLSEQKVIENMSETEQKDFNRLLRTAYTNLTGNIPV